MGGGVDGQVAALAVSAHVEGTVCEQRGLLEVFDGGALSRHGALEGHVEVLPPAHDGGIRPPEGDVVAAVGQVEDDCSKLHVPVLVGDGYGMPHSDADEALGHRGGVEQAAALVHKGKLILVHLGDG